MDDEKIDWLIRVLAIFMIIGIVVFGAIEAITLLAAYITADEVKCTFLWCEFTTTRSSSTTDYIHNQTCSVNGVPANCSELDLNWGD